MALIKKRDVNDYFAARRRARLHSLIPASQPVASANSKSEIELIPSAASAFAEDFREEHSSPGSSIKPTAGKGRGAL